ncbi:MAG: MlaD family protein [Thermoleophilaceae bacterium]
MSRRRATPFGIGLIGLVLVVFGTYFAFTKSNPFAQPYELKAVFESANNLAVRSPVRIAGIDVGKVTRVESLGDGSGMARVTMELDDEALPIKRDAELKVRSRLFLEGNYFVELHPGSPPAREVDSGHTIPPNQTAFPVQFGQVLSALQSDTREDLQSLLRELSDGYRGSGARGFNQAIRHWESAYRNTALVSQATLGEEEHDLTRVLDGQARVFGALSRDERALMDLVTDLNATVASFAEQEDNLRAAIPELRDVLREGRPALQSLNTALPSIRAFARDALPGARSSRATLDAQIPFITQARRLVSPGEAGGLAEDLRETVPALVRLNERSARSFEQTRALARCQNRVLLPFSTTPVPDPAFPEHSGEAFFEESPRAFVGLSGESRLADANTPYFRTLATSGATTVVSTGELGERLYGQVGLPLLGVRPPRPPQAPVFRPNVPCETQEPPDLSAPAAAGDQQVQAQPQRTASDRRRAELGAEQLEEITTHLDSVLRGLPSIDPLQFSEEGIELQSDLLGLVRTRDGRWRERR